MGGVLFADTRWLGGASMVIAVLAGWVALQAAAPLARKQVTYGLAAFAFAVSGFVMAPGLIAGACVVIGWVLLFLAIRNKD